MKLDSTRPAAFRTRAALVFARFSRAFRITVLTLVAVTATATLHGCGPRDAQGTQQPGAGPEGGRGGRGGGMMGYPAGQAVPVEIGVAQRTPLVRATTVSGVLEPVRVVAVTSILGGTLLAIHAEEGTRVRAGTVLAELDTRELSAQLRSAEAGLALARGNFERAGALLRERVITPAEYERDRAAFASAESTVDQIRTRIGFARIAAPIAGVVSEKFVEAGDVVSGQRQLFTIADVATLVTRLAVSELEVVDLEAGAAVTVTVDAIPGQEIQGRIRRIFPSADPATRLVPVEVALAGNALPGLRPGFTVRARLALDADRTGITVPTRSLQGGSSSRYLFVLQGNRVTRRTVRAGDDIDGLSEIFSGVNEGDTVVVAGNALLRDGGTVRVVQPLRSDSAAQVNQIRR